MKRILALFFIFSLATACSSNNDDEAIIKAKPLDENSSVAAAELEEIIVEEEVMMDYIEFNLDEEQILIDINKVPILHEFLRMHPHPQEATQEMNLEKIELGLQNIYTLSFSCNNERCSYILFHQNQNNQAFLLADMAQYINSYISPDQSKIALHFNRSREETMPLSNLVIVDINEWSSLSLISKEGKTSIMNYKWPFLSVEWLDEENIAISIPELIEPSKESYDEWTITEGNSVDTVVLQIDTE